MAQQPSLALDDPGASCQRILLPDAELMFHRAAFSHDEAQSHFDSLSKDTPWRSDHIQIHGKAILIPRLQTWYSTIGAPLNYSGMSVPPLPWTDELLAIAERVHSLTGLTFNGVLLNYYRNGNDSVGWHADNEAEFGPNPIIASLSLGATRDFVLKHATRPELKPVTLSLDTGSLLIMGQGVQQHWRHQLPKRKRVLDPRINLTFRNIVSV